jgi:hypothetical protein
MGSSGNENDKPVVVVEQRVEVIVQVESELSVSSMPGSDGEHRLQEKYGRTTHALAFYKHQVIDHLNPAMQAFLARQEMMFRGHGGRRGTRRLGLSMRTCGVCESPR